MKASNIISCDIQLKFPPSIHGGVVIHVPKGEKELNSYRGTEFEAHLPLWR